MLNTALRWRFFPAVFSPFGAALASAACPGRGAACNAAPQNRDPTSHGPRISSAPRRKCGVLRNIRGTPWALNFKDAPRHTRTHPRILATRIAPELLGKSPSKTEGAGNAGCAARTHSLACEMKKHTSVVTTGKPPSTGIPRAMVLTVSFALSPVTGLVCHRRLRKISSANLTPASGRQDHTTSPSALARLVKRTNRVHRIPLPTSVTIASRPSLRQRDGDRYAGDLGVTGTGKFLPRDLDS